MAATDRAIIVGIENYPSFAKLGGPENDARAFEAWVRSAAGGNVPEANIRTILAKIPNPRYNDPVRPGYWEIEEAFGELMDLAAAGRAKWQTWTGRIGRRLYIYLAGHGFDLEEAVTALLAANATPQKTGNHFLGKPYAELFAEAALFNEIVLVVDCCRETDVFRVAPNMPRLREERASPAAQAMVGWFHAFAGQPRSKTRERPFPPSNDVRGVFTKTLLVGLEGGAADPVTGDITIGSLSDFLYENMKTYLDPADLIDGDVAKIPAISFDPKDKNLVLANVPPPVYLVTIRLPAGLATGLLSIEDQQFHPVVAPVLITATPVVVSLPRGSYRAEILGVSKRVIEVTGKGAVDVIL